MSTALTLQAPFLLTAPRPSLLLAPRGPTTPASHTREPDHGVHQLPRRPSRRPVAAAAASVPAVAAATAQPAQPAQPALLQRLGAFLAANYLPCGLLTSVVLG